MAVVVQAGFGVVVLALEPDRIGSFRPIFWAKTEGCSCASPHAFYWALQAVLPFEPVSTWSVPRWSRWYQARASMGCTVGLYVHSENKGFVPLAPTIRLRARNISDQERFAQSYLIINIAVFQTPKLAFTNCSPYHIK
jgi:hypothetical protein